MRSNPAAKLRIRSAPDLTLAWRHIARSLRGWQHRRITPELAQAAACHLALRLPGYGHEDFRGWSEEPAGRSMAAAERQITRMLLVRGGMVLTPQVLEERARAIAQVIEELGWAEVAS